MADERHRWLRRAWFEAAGGPEVATLVAAKPDRGVFAALPLVGLGRPSLGIRAVPGSYWPFRSFPVAQEASDDDLAAFLAAPVVRRTLGRAWRLGPVEGGDPTVSRLLRVSRASGWSVLQRQVGTFFRFDIGEARKDGDWPRASTVRNNKKHEKRLAKLGPLEFRFVTGGDWTSQVFDDLTRIERNSWVATKAGADAKFVDPLRRRGWERIAGDPVIGTMLSAGILYIGGEPVSFSFGINSGSIRYCVATSYDQRFARHSPGTVTGYRTYIEAARRGVTMLDLGSGDGGEKSGMGAAAGPAVMDYLFVRNPVLAALLRPMWRSRR